MGHIMYLRVPFGSSAGFNNLPRPFSMTTVSECILVSAAIPGGPLSPLFPPHPPVCRADNKLPAF